MDIIHLTDLPFIFFTIVAAALPEVIPGFQRGPALLRLAIVTTFCVIATVFAFYLQHADPAASFTRAFLLAQVARVTLVLAHMQEDSRRRNTAQDAVQGVPTAQEAK